MTRQRIGLAACTLLCIAAPFAHAAGQAGQEPAPSRAITFDQQHSTLPKVVIVTTGGTIAERRDPKTGGLVPSLSGKQLVAAVPGLKKIANVGVLDFSDIDSSHMTPQMWADLSRSVDRVLKMDDVVGAVVTHGTDTMAEGAFFLDVTLTSDKPVVFTGAMNGASDPAPDGPGNIYDAVLQVTSDEAKDWGVTVTLNRYVNAARHVRKTDTTNVQTFESGDFGYLGYIHGERVRRYNDRPGRVRLPVPDRLPKVAYIAAYAGDDGAFVRHAVEQGAEGIVVQAVGAGNVNAEVGEAIQHALDQNVAVVIATRVAHGAVEPIYADKGGGARLLKEGCILAGDLDGPKARLLLMLGLAEHGNDRAELEKLFGG